MKNIKILLIILSIFIFLPTSNIAQDNGYLAFADKMPEPVGGLPAIYKLIKYPEIAKRAGVEGKVYVLAFINESGSVDDVKIVKGIGAGCDEATVEAVKQSKFSPGESAGQPAKVKMSLQIQFKLS
jgi:protein TonB